MKIFENNWNFTMQISECEKQISQVFSSGNINTYQKINGIYFEASNINSTFDYKKDMFFSSCPDIHWDNDIRPLIAESWFFQKKECSIVIGINIEKKERKFVLDTETIIDNNYSTAFNLNIICNLHGDNFTVRKTHLTPKHLDKKSLIEEIKIEISKIENNYREYVLNELIDISPESVDIILPTGVGGIFIHEAIGHCLEADFFYSKKNFLFKKAGHRLANNDIYISDICGKNDIINFPISYDGTKPIDVSLVEGGYLKDVMSDAYCLKKHGVKDTGNGRATDYQSPPLVRMRNTYLHNGKIEPDEIIRTTKSGVIATEIQGGNVIYENGSFVFNIAHGLVVKNGEIIGISKPLLFSGSVQKSLDTIDVIGNDLSFVAAKCNKAGQLLTVSYGQPTIRIRNKQ